MIEGINLTTREIKNLVSELQFTPSKKFGQNFLTDSGVIDKLMNSIQLTDTDNVLEIGGGLGALTLPVSSRVRELVVYEIDPVLQKVITQRLNNVQHSHIRLIPEDFLRSQLDWLGQTNYKVISSLPYRTGSPILHKLITEYIANWPTGVFLLQTEVMEKINQAPPKGSYWYAFIHMYYEVEVVIRTVRPEAFWPQPGVNSSAIKLIRKPEYQIIDPADWSSFLHRVFRFPRKQINKIAGIVQSQLSVGDLSKRPGELSLMELIQLYNSQV
jgi:16S rRNA (adenine1518-N6/adenine1519-N6)-dimethyltransferase